MEAPGKSRKIPRLAATVTVMSVFILTGLLAGATVVERSVAALDQPWLRNLLAGPVALNSQASRFLGLGELQSSLHEAWTSALSKSENPGLSVPENRSPASGTEFAGVDSDPVGNVQASPDALDAAENGSPGTEPGVFGPERPFRLLAIGDSQAMGPDFAFKRNVGKDDWYAYQGEYRLSSTLANPGVYDWPARLEAYLASGPQDALVVYLGSNDAQAIRDGEGQAEFDSPAWRAIMETRIRDFMALACQGAGRVYWMACPPMRDPGFNRKIQVINRLYRDCAREFPKVAWMEFRDLLYSGSGDYVQGKMVNGRQVELRKEDGIHLSRPGYEYVCARLLRQIEADFAFRRPPPVYPIFGETLSGL